MTKEVQIPARLLLYGIFEQAHTEALYAGIKAAVWMYYEEYTDATDIYDELLPVLEQLSNLLCLDEDELYKTIQEAEADYNSDPAASLNTEGKRRKVKTELPFYPDLDEEDCGR